MPRFCTSCGQPVNDGVRFCTNCGAPVAVEQTNYQQPDPDIKNTTESEPEPQVQQTQQIYVGNKPKSYLGWSIVVTVLCCWPFGIPAIVNSAKVNNRWNESDYAGAQEASQKAKKWIIVSAILGLIANVVYLISSGLVDQL